MAATAAASGEEGREEEVVRRARLRASLMDMVSRSMAADVSCLVLGFTSREEAGAAAVSCGAQATSSALSEPPCEASCAKQQRERVTEWGIGRSRGTERCTPKTCLQCGWVAAPPNL